MTTVKKMKDAKKAALQSELEFYENLLSQHEKSKSYSACDPNLKHQNSGAGNHGTRVQTAVRTIKKSLVKNDRSSPVVDKTSRSASHKCSTVEPNRRTVTYNNQFKTLASKSLYVNSKKHFYKSELHHTNSSAFPSSSFHPLAGHSKITVAHNNILHIRNNKINSEKKTNLDLKSKDLTQTSKDLMNEIRVLTEQLKQKSKKITIAKVSDSSAVHNCQKNYVHLKPSNVKISNVSQINSYKKINKGVLEINSLVNKDSNNRSGNEILSKTVLNAPKPVIKCFEPNLIANKSNSSNLNLLSDEKSKINSVNLSFKPPGVLKNSSANSPICNSKEILSKPVSDSCTKLEKSLKGMTANSALKTPVKLKVFKMPLSSLKKKPVTKLIASKYKVINKRSPCLRTVIFGKTFQKSNVKSACKSLDQKFPSRKWTRLTENNVAKVNFKINNLNSKYKIVNKIENPALSEPQSIKKNIFQKRRLDLPTKSFVRNLPSKRSNKMVFNKSATHLKRSGTPLSAKKATSRNSLGSKYKIINKYSTCSQDKISRRTVNSNKVCDVPNSSMDFDLLLELAAEKGQSTDSTKHTVTPKKSVLVKRVYKSKNAIINTNACSPQTRVAKMIKTKYSILNKKHTWQRQFISKKHSSSKFFKGHVMNTSFHRKSSTFPFYNQRNKRNYTRSETVYCIPSSSFTVRHYRKTFLKPRNKFISYGPHRSTRKYERHSAHPKLFVKSPSTTKSPTVYKTLASRALHRSINRVLTASVKKKTSKVSTYCMFYNRFGRCNKGVKCPYVHDPSKIAVCTRFLRGTCKMEKCPFSHEICPGKMAICSFFLLGSCTKSDCPYRHETLPPNAKLCKAFVQGYCPNGKECKQAHVLVCPQFVQGHCEKGDTCPFPHPPAKERKNSPKQIEESVNPKESEEPLMEKMSRYFEPLGEQVVDRPSTSSLAVPRLRSLPEQPSFIALSFSDSES